MFEWIWQELIGEMTPALKWYILMNVVGVCVVTVQFQMQVVRARVRVCVCVDLCGCPRAMDTGYYCSTRGSGLE